MRIKLHPKQLEVANDTHRFRIVCAGRRWGKSVLSELITLKWALEKQGLYWIVSPTYRQSKQIHWRQLNQLVYDLKLPVDKKNEVELSITLKNGSIIELKGAENPDALRGVKLRGLVIDEIASIRNWDWLWSEVLRPTLTDYSAPALFISTPKGYNHFYDLFQQGTDSLSDYKSWRFTSYDNPYIPKGEIDNAKKDLSEDTFAQEYLADFRRFTGAIFKSFTREINVIKPFKIPSEWQRGRGFDFGSDDPTASLRISVDNDDNWFYERSYKRTDIIKGHAEAIQAQDYGLSFTPIFGDPSGGQWYDEFRNYGLQITPATREHTPQQSWVNLGYEKVDNRFKPIPGHTVYLPDGRVINNAPKAFILDIPENWMFIKEIESAEWKKNRDGNTIAIIDDLKDPEGHYDLIACARYFAVSYRKRDEDSFPEEKLFDQETGLYI